MIRWNHTHNGATETLTLVQIEGRDGYAVQITTGPETGDDFVGLYAIDEEMGRLSLPYPATWEAVTSAPPDVIAEVEELWWEGSLERIQ